jgi:hypothetical protein
VRRVCPTSGGLVGLDLPADRLSPQETGGKPVYETIRDTTLPHQVVLMHQNRRSDIQVSCNCRAVKSRINGMTHYEPMGSIVDFPDTVRLYNDPANHNQAIGHPGTKWAGLLVPFGEEWMLNGQRRQSI